MSSKRLLAIMLVIVLVFSNASIAFAAESLNNSTSGDGISLENPVEGTTDGAIDDEVTTEEAITTEDAIVTQQSMQNNISVMSVVVGEYTVGCYSSNGAYENIYPNGFNTVAEANTKMSQLYNGSVAGDNGKKYNGNNGLVVVNKNGYVLNMINGMAYFKSSSATVNIGNSYVTPNTPLHYYSSTGTKAKVGVSGAVSDGVSILTSKGAVNLVLIPGSLVNAPGFYTKDYYVRASNGDLWHYVYKIASTTTGSPYTYVSGKTKTTYVGVFTVDKAHSYMKTGTNYYSADGINFYKGINLTSHVVTYYPYFKYLPYRTRSNYTYTNLNAWIKANTKSNSKLRNQGRNLINAQNRYGINAVNELAFACLESGYGVSTYALKRNNLFGINAVDSNPNKATYFSSVRVNINQHANTHLSRGYGDAKGDWKYFGLIPGNKDTGVNVKYASDPWHGEKISGIAYKMDKSLGSKDYRKYKVGVTNKSNVPVYKTAGKTYLYNLSTYKSGAGVPVVILGTSGSYYMIQSEVPISGNVAKYSYTYYYDKSIAYVKKSDLNIINNGSITFSNKHKANRDLRNITVYAGKSKVGKTNYFSGFNPHKTSYTIKVPRNTKKIKITGSRLMPVTSKVTGNGTKKFTVKKSKTFSIKVKSKSGKTKTYKIKVVRK